MMKVSASLLAANKQDLINELKRVENAGIDLLHFDVMDNVFVPNTSFNDDTFSNIRKHFKGIFEVHLMVKNPLDYINKYPFSAEDVIIVHYECFESNEACLTCLNEIKKTHKVGLSIKPKTDVKVLLPFLSILDYILIMSVEPGFGGQKFMEDQISKTTYLTSIQNQYHYVIEIDGGINKDTIHFVKDSVDIVVSGSYLFKGDMKSNAEALI